MELTASNDGNYEDEIEMDNDDNDYVDESRKSRQKLAVIGWLLPIKLTVMSLDVKTPIV